METLVQRFPPLPAASIRRVASDFDEGFTPVDVLIRQLVEQGIGSIAAVGLIRELRELRSRPHVRSDGGRLG